MLFLVAICSSRLLNVRSSEYFLNSMFWLKVIRGDGHEAHRSLQGFLGYLRLAKKGVTPRRVRCSLIMFQCQAMLTTVHISAAIRHSPQSRIYFHHNPLFCVLRPFSLSNDKQSIFPLRSLQQATLKVENMERDNTSNPHLATYACASCRQRKRKCDKVLPRCSLCSK